MLEALKTIPSVEKNPQAALEQLSIDRDNARKRMAKYNIIKQNMEANGYQGSPDDYLNDSANLADYSMSNTDHIQQQNNDFIKVISPSGIVGEISKNNLADAIKDGYKEVAKSSKNESKALSEAESAARSKAAFEEYYNNQPTSFKGDFDIPNQDGYRKNIMPLFEKMR
jgi:hypothetical protein